MHAKLIFCRSVFPIKKKISKFGGIPNWIDKPTWPISKSTKRPMKFLCQIRLDQKIFPNCIGKMAYIFMSDDDKEFIDDTYEPESGENAVIIQPENIPAFIETQALESISHTFEEYNLELEYIHEENQENFYETKIGKEPYFLQGEEFPKGNIKTLLLQLKEKDCPFRICFGGDCGIAYAFINEDGTEGRFLWQC